jgi:hypothetical protein
MPRVPYIGREELAEEERQYYDSIAHGRDRVPGTDQMMLHSPDMAARMWDLSRTSRTVEEWVRGICILTIARERNTQTVWTAHDSSAREAGVRDVVTDAIRDRSTEGLTADERLYIEYTKKVLTNHVDAVAFRGVEQRLGTRGIVELSLTIGFSTMLCQFMDTFESEMGAGRSPLLPVP